MTAAPIDMTRKEEEAIERVVEEVVTNLRPIGGAVLSVEAYRGMVKGFIRMGKLPIPADEWLDELIVELCEFHEVPIEAAS
jgi:hypothetical protein